MLRNYASLTSTYIPSFTELVCFPDPLPRALSFTNFEATSKPTQMIYLLRSEMMEREIVPAGGHFYEFLKRTFDIVSSFCFLLLFGWIILLLLFIKFCEDGHNPIYTSKRVGKNGKIFKFHKIRSMRPDAEKLKQQLIAEGKNEATYPVFKMKNDPRITKFGRFIRKHNLDELPQIYDVLVGRLSIIGPRSPLIEEAKTYSSYERHRLDVKGGLLCYWQIQPKRNKVSFDEWVDLDIQYVETRSVKTDMKILFKGIFSCIKKMDGE